MSREPTRTEVFLELFEIWRKHFKMLPIETRADLRYHCHACIETWNEEDEYHEKGYKELVYNPRKLAKWNYALLISGAFHELGHCRHDLPYNTFEEQVKSEHKAESFAIRMMTRYYPRELQEVIAHVKANNLGKSRWIKKWPVHYAAYQRIGVYKI